jgi:ATP synthase protein I
MVMRTTKNSGEALRTAGALSTVGLSFVLALVIGFWIGSRVDACLHTGPVMAIVGFFLGLAAGILNVFRIVSRAFPTGAAASAPGRIDGASPPASTVTKPVDDTVAADD